jgi:hypothetical protein
MAPHTKHAKNCQPILNLFNIGKQCWRNVCHLQETLFALFFKVKCIDVTSWWPMCCALGEILDFWTITSFALTDFLRHVQILLSMFSGQCLPCTKNFRTAILRPKGVLLRKDVPIIIKLKDSIQ